MAEQQASRTWREELDAAFAAVDEAIEARRRVVQAASDAGISLRDIAEVVTKAPSTILRMIGKRSDPASKALLDSPCRPSIEKTTG